MSGPKGCELELMRREQERLAIERDCAVESSRYQRLMDAWNSTRNRCEDLLIPTAFKVTPHNQLSSEMNQLLQQGAGAQALRNWQARASELEKSINQAKSNIAGKILELENRNRSYGAGVEQYREHLSSITHQLNSLIPQDWPDADRSTLRSALQALQAECASPPAPRSAWNPGNIRFLEENEASLITKRQLLKRKAEDFEKQLQQMHAKKVTTSLLSGAAAVQKLEDFLKTLETEPSSTGQSGAMDEQACPDLTDAKLEKLMKDIIALENSFDWKSILEESDRIRSEKDTGRRQTLYANLVIRCSGRLKEMKALSLWREKLLDLIDRASSLPEDKPLAELRKRMNLLLKRDLPENLKPLEKELDVVVQEAVARQEQEKKRRAVIESLMELGYETSEGMEVAITKGGKLEFRKPDDKEYAISVVMDSKSETLETEMVRYASSQEMTAQQKQRDLEKEEGWCSDHARVREAMKSRGVAAKFLYQKRPGEHPVTVKITQSDQRNRESASAKVHARKLPN